MHNLIKSVLARIDSEQRLIWIRKKDFQLISTTGCYWLYTGKKKKRTISWYNASRPYYTNYQSLKVFLKRHELIGEL